MVGLDSLRSSCIANGWSFRRWLCCMFFLSLCFGWMVCMGQLFIDEPPNLVGFIQGSTAAFGTPQYGQYILGRLYYGHSTDVSTPNCLPGYELIPKDEPAAEWKKVIILRRGGCPFSDKVKVAQDNHNADAVIIVDSDSRRNSSDIRMIIMADDNPRKRDIHIPSILISSKEGEPLIDAILNGADVYGRLEWDIPNAETVIYTQWVSPALAQSVKFLQKFARVARTFGDELNFRPHYWVFPMSRPANSMCTDSTGQFCSVSPDWGNQTAGKEVVEEIVRQKCLWRESSAKGFPSGFWSYVEEFPTSCPARRPDMSGSSAFMSRECSMALMKRVGAPLASVQMCINDEFDDILNEEKASGAWSPTATMINDWRYAGPLTPEDVASAICTGFFEEPSACDTVRAISPTNSEDGAQFSRGVPWWVYVTSIFGVIGATLLLIICYRTMLYKRLRNELRYEIFEEVKQRTDMEKIEKSKENSPNTKNDLVEQLGVPSIELRHAA